MRHRGCEDCYGLGSLLHFRSRYSLILVTAVYDTLFFLPSLVDVALTCQLSHVYIKLWPQTFQYISVQSFTSSCLRTAHHP
ncbi:hypothetical protein GQ43DRAFT_306335 [Delitschia confertaspora ATCC 74209]|uniref:Uncharacterized protein n=1 Tax=Delitschia confertaspora ATCC 74209 TaxID=1513339 RepID=A0A9P4JN96_9PLEO|nr:hypothetical protein GQ43DRAFT_306335 [Delitschia confertaspora ATCC 74209]